MFAPPPRYRPCGAPGAGRARTGRLGVVTVDAHVHLLPPRLGEAIRRFFAEHGLGEETWRYPLDHGEIVGRLAAEGVSTVWSLPYARRPGTAPGLNEASAGTAAAHAGGPVRVVGGATVHPGDADPAGIVRAAVEQHGLRVLKLHCSVGDYRPDDPGLDPVWAYVSEVRLPVVVHVGHAVSGHSDATEVAAIGVVARRFPEARVVIAHCGHRAVAAALDLTAAHPNVYADLTPVVLDPVELPAGRVDELADKLLFGSDCPNTGITVTEGLAVLGRTGAAPASLLAITGGNAERLHDEVRA
jgi:predicted TIM-barrel fold metal-dependent hydrolase